MIQACPSYLDAGPIDGVLATIDCQTRVYAQGGYEALTQGSGLFGAALTLLLTIYVALIGWRLLVAPEGARLSEAPGVALRIGAILALVTNWSVFQTLVFDVADRAPVQIAAAVSAPWTSGGEGRSLAARPVAGLERAHSELRGAAAAFGVLAPPNAKAYASSDAASAEALSLAADALMVMSVGVVGGAKLAIGVLTAVGPVFIALALLNVTRGVFFGWVRALAGSALSLLVGWALLIMLLVVLAPWLAALAEQRQAQVLDPRTATSLAALILVFAVGQGVLILAAWVAALGLKMGTAPATPASTAVGTTRPEPAAVLQVASRADRLAQALTQDGQRFESRVREITLAGAAARQAPVQIAGPRPADTIGGGYRRPVATRRRGGA
ncbi:type IV secretion system protein [Phenylobacterium sp.]|uniref:type IV secretion system protein n=3 Tax=Phenylobacterium sp. TaxID=1871053 RepID=UPI0025F0AA52|nr:type IV secretion system protein [Phenylobacterium sp.]MCA3742290.1 type IV secretion system protein [Phenylobacterium sp.]MCA3755788.1 type IV secretion system protein [Phenylobacterium sp.]